MENITYISGFNVYYKINGLEKSVLIPNTKSFDELGKMLERVKKEIELDIEHEEPVIY